MCNSYDNMINDLPRTNNAIEGWHNAFCTGVRKYHNALNKFLNFLIEEQNYNEILLDQKDAARDIRRPKRKKYRDYDLCLKNVVELYDRNDVMRYLSNISCNIKF